MDGIHIDPSVQKQRSEGDHPGEVTSFLTTDGLCHRLWVGSRRQNRSIATDGDWKEGRGLYLARWRDHEY